MTISWVLTVGTLGVIACFSMGLHLFLHNLPSGCNSFLRFQPWKLLKSGDKNLEKQEKLGKNSLENLENKVKNSVDTLVLGPKN